MTTGGRLLAIAAFVAVFPSISLPIQAAALLPSRISVGLSDHQREVLIESAGPFTVRDGATSAVLMKTSHFHLAIQGLEWTGDGRRTPADIILEPGADNLLRYQGRLYRGTLEIKRAGPDRILVINHVAPEDYLQGVLPFEALPSWKPETLKAQAVVSRTYVAASLWRHGADGYDVCPQTHCQVYRGASGEDPRTNQAVDATAGEIMTYHGKPIEAYFHDDCGGMTESAQDVWTGGGYLPYLKRVRCPSVTSWKASVSAEDLCQAIPSPKLDASDIKSLRITAWTPSGRAKTITISTRRHGKITIPANTLRLRLGADIIKSTFWRRIQRRRSGWEIWGTGWGHGVGLCQWGAERLGERGWNDDQILKHYFKGIKIERAAS